MFQNTITDPSLCRGLAAGVWSRVLAHQGRPGRRVAVESVVDDWEAEGADLVDASGEPLVSISWPPAQPGPRQEPPMRPIGPAARAQLAALARVALRVAERLVIS